MPCSFPSIFGDGCEGDGEDDASDLRLNSVAVTFGAPRLAFALTLALVSARPFSSISLRRSQYTWPSDSVQGMINAGTIAPKAT